MRGFTACSSDVTMTRWFRSYHRYTRGESSRFSPWLALEPLGLLGSAYTRFRNGLYDHGILESLEPPLPVISVGNLTVGGTNKTPFVEMLVSRLAGMELLPGILTRGYGGKTDRPVLIRSGEGDRAQVGDEPLLLSSRLPEVPVAVSRDRLKGAGKLREAGARIAVADDAFQHRRLGRDVEIVLVDACCPFGNGSIVPAGPLREGPSGLKRAHAVVITKFDQVSPEEGELLKERLLRWIPPDRLFTARLVLGSWARWEGAWEAADDALLARGPVLAFSAIGSPGSFLRFVRDLGVDLAGQLSFRDHHRFCLSDMERIASLAREKGARCLVCTEKDVYNLPPDWRSPLPLLIPRVSIKVGQEERFWKLLRDRLRPRLVVASNGHGEDAIGAVLAGKLTRSFPEAQVIAFPLVGAGEPYRERGIPVASPPAESPSGGVVKYDVRDLLRDIRAGLFGHIARQVTAWKRLKGSVRSPVCVGDVYLLLHTLWGQGKTPLFLATAKSVRIAGHMKSERRLLRRRCRMVWTRDAETARELEAAGVAAVFSGNPIMDLDGDNLLGGVPSHDGRDVVLLLPGSRPRAYADIAMVLEAARSIAESRDNIRFRMVLAPTLRIDSLQEACPGWAITAAGLQKAGLFVELFEGTVAQAARGARVVLGLGGTANQVCAGLGVPVVSVREPGKFVQKKLLGDAEVLVDSDSVSLARGVLRILEDKELHARMAAEGRKRLGPPGALDDVVRYADEELGWGLRSAVYRSLCDKEGL